MDTVELIYGWIGSGDVAGWLGPVAAAPFAGSFLGVLIARLPEGRGWAWDRSACPACGHALGPADLVPVASFLALRGRCRFCGAPIGRFHLWVELGALALAIWAAALGERGALLWAGCTLGWALLALGWIDIRCQRLPDVLTLPLVVAGLAEAAWLEPDALTDRALGAALGYTVFRALAWGYRRLRRREGLGLGDAKLAAAAGAWTGALALPDVILGAALTALAWALASAWRRRRMDPAARVTFGPFLAVATWFVWLYFWV